MKGGEEGGMKGGEEGGMKGGEEGGMKGGEEGGMKGGEEGGMKGGEEGGMKGGEEGGMKGGGGPVGEMPHYPSQHSGSGKPGMVPGRLTFPSSCRSFLTFLTLRLPHLGRHPDFTITSGATETPPKP